MPAGSGIELGRLGGGVAGHGGFQRLPSLPYVGLGPPVPVRVLAIDTVRGPAAWATRSGSAPDASKEPATRWSGSREDGNRERSPELRPVSLDLHRRRSNGGHRFPFASVAAHTRRASTISARSQLWRSLTRGPPDRCLGRRGGGERRAVVGLARPTPKRDRRFPRTPLTSRVVMTGRSFPSTELQGAQWSSLCNEQRFVGL